MRMHGCLEKLLCEFCLFLMIITFKKINHFLLLNICTGILAFFKRLKSLLTAAVQQVFLSILSVVTFVLFFPVAPLSMKILCCNAKYGNCSV